MAGIPRPGNPGLGNAKRAGESAVVRPHPRNPGTGTSSTTRRDPSTIIRDAIRAVRGAGRFGNRKVFISEIWRKAKGELGMTLDELKRMLVDLHRSQEVVLARADLVAAMDPELVAASETKETPGTSYPMWHFAIDDSIA